MECTSTFSWLDAIGKRDEKSRSVASLGWLGLKIAPGPAAAIVLGLGSPANAQAIPWTNEQIASPWNAQRIFEPSSRPELTDPDSREEIRAFMVVWNESLRLESMLKQAPSLD